MKKLSYFLVLFITMTFGIFYVDAASIKCPENIGTEDKVVCDVYANLTDKLTNIAFSGIDDSTIYDEVEAGDNAKLGTISITAKNTRGEQDISFTISGDYEGEDTFNDSVSTSISVKSKITKLKSVSVDKSSVTNNSITVSKDSVVIEALGEEHVTVISGTGTKKLSCGSNKAAITTKAEAGNTATLNIDIIRECDNNKTLKAIKVSLKDKDGKDVSASLSPSFSSSVKSYKMDVDTNTDKITIKSTKQNEKQKVSGDVSDKTLEYGENKFTIKVTSEKGESDTYTIIVNRKDERGDTATLKSLKLSNGKLEFRENKLDYTTKVLYNVTKIDVEAVSDDDKAKIEITGNTDLKVGSNTIVVKVISENEKNTKEYRIIVNRLKEGEVLGDNAYIKSLKINGYDIDFDRDKFTYTIKIKDDKALKFTVVMDEEGATYKVLNNNSLEDGSIVKIVTKSLDNEESLTYKINIEKESNLFIFIIVGVSLVLAIVLVVFFIIKGKKKKKNNKVSNDDLVEKEDNINLEKTMEYKNDLESNVSYKSSIPANEDILVNLEEKSTRPMTTREELRRELMNDDFDIYSSILTSQDVKQIRKEHDAFEDVIEPKRESSSKVCSICGHKVTSSARICPYCKRTF